MVKRPHERENGGRVSKAYEIDVGDRNSEST